MGQWLRRIRGAIGIGLTWAVAWGVAGGLLARVPGFYSDLPFALWFAPLGLITGVLFSGILVAMDRHRDVDRESLLRCAAWGAVSGLLLSGAIGANTGLRGGDFWGEFVGFAGPLALGSAASAAGSLALARKARRWRTLFVQLNADLPSEA